METSTLLLIGAIILLFLLYDYWCHQYFKRLGIPTPPVVPILGHFYQFVTDMVNCFDNYSEQCGKVFGIYTFTRPTLVICDPDVLKEILVRNFSSFHDRRPPFVKDAPLDKALTNLTGARWKKVRNTCTPAFSANKLKLMSYLVNNCCDNLVVNLKADVDAGKNIEMKAKYGNMTMDTIACCAFGMDINSQNDPSNPFIINTKALFKFSLRSPRILLILGFPFLRPLFDMLGIGLLPQGLRNFFVNVIGEAIEMRQNQKSPRRDMLQLLMDAHKEEEVDQEENTEDKIYREPLTNDEIVAQSVVFFLAGYETTNVALMFFSYCMAVNPECQEKLISEIDEFCNDRGSANYETVSKMQYLDMCVCESLRMYPPAIVADRKCNETVTVKGITIPAGMNIFYGIHAIHFNPEYWEEPTKFIPERFTKKNKDKRHPYAYLPFGTGPRNCIGMRFALFEVKMAIVRVMQNFKFEPCEETDIPPKFGKVGISPDNGITLRLIARNQD